MKSAPGTHDAGAVAEEPPVFVGETLAALERQFADYPTKQALLLPALWMVQ